MLHCRNGEENKVVDFFKINTWGVVGQGLFACVVVLTSPKHGGNLGSSEVRSNANLHQCFSLRLLIFSALDNSIG